jgi:lycopene cyclase domain-containing protein
LNYLGFLVTFVAPAVLAAGWSLRGRTRRGDVLRLIAICTVAFVAAYPWDRHAVLAGYWHFPAERVHGWVGPLPAEECAYFVLETLGVALLTMATFRRSAR